MYAVRGRRAVLAGFCAVFLAAAAGTATASASASAAQSRSLAQSTTLARAPAASYPAGSNLYGVTATAADDVWAVGDHPIGGNGVALIEHWDGSHWSHVSAPTPGVDSRLYDVSATSATDAWAVGYFTDAEFRLSKLILHWDGTSWTRVRIDGGTHPDRMLTGVTALSSSDVWVVGYRFNQQGAFKSLILHWDGSTWTRTPSPNPAGVVLSSVTATSSTDVWAVGYDDPSGSETFPLILHYDGRRWTTVDAHDSGDFDYLTGVTATAPDDAWAVGLHFDGAHDSGLIEHWDGQAWTVVPGPMNGTLLSVDAASSTDAWAVGYVFVHRTYRDLFMHWDGTGWTQVAGANPGYAQPGLSDVVDLDTDDAWAVGTYDDNDTTYAQHWDGTRWKVQ
jgi:hypothetical protein